MKLAFCWVHVRRAFVDFATKRTSPIAVEVLNRIAALYRIDSEISGQPALRRLRPRRRALGRNRLLVETCRLNGVDPQAYLADAITRIVESIPQSRLDELMPWADPTIPGLKAAA